MEVEVSFLLRWSVWGSKRRIAEMLPYSIETFRYFFGADARYVVCTDEVSDVRSLLRDYVEVIPLMSSTSSFGVDSAATWKKWCPRPRLAPESTELHIDSDVFLVGQPIELLAFSVDPSRTYTIMQEAAGSPHWVGRFRSRIYFGIPPVNIGLLGQRAGTDITNDLAGELRWWLDNVRPDERQYHDDQGAVVAILAREYILGRLELLPIDRYCIVNHRANVHLTSLDNVTAIHATMGHYAFKRFKNDIAAFAHVRPDTSI